MIQTILTLTIVALAAAKVVYSLYIALTTKDKSLCGGCGGCDIKSELKKKGKLMAIRKIEQPAPDSYSPQNLRFISKNRP